VAKKIAFGYLRKKKYSLYRSPTHLFRLAAEIPSGQHPPVHQSYMIRLSLIELLFLDELLSGR
jgi:hypothetical protein